MIGICLILTLLGFAFTYIAFEINEDKDSNGMFIAGLIMTIIFSAGLGYSISKEYGFETNYIITPKVHVVCDNGKCDTTYIYESKTK